MIDATLRWVPSAVTAGLLLGFAAYFAWRRPAPTLARPMTAVLIGALLFIAGDLGSMVARSAAVDWYALLVLYAGHSLLVPGAWFLALGVAESQGARPTWANRRWVHFPIVWFALLWVALVLNPWHGHFLTANPGTRSTYHALWYVFGLSGYALTLSAFGLFVHRAVRAERERHRYQGIVMAVGAGVTLAGNFAYVLSPEPLPFDPTAVGIGLTTALFLHGIYRGQLFSLNPIALRELALQDTDGVLVIDRSGNLLFANPAGGEWLGAPTLREGEPLLARLAARLRPAATFEDASQGEPLDPATIERLVYADPPTRGGHLFRAAPEQTWIRLETTSIRDPDSEGVAAYALRLRDETTIHELIAAAADQASTLTAVMSATDEGILVQLDGEVRWANEQFHEIWGTPPELRDTRSPAELVDCYRPLIADRERFDERVAAVARDPSAVVRRDLELTDGRILEHAGMPLRRGDDVVGRVWRIRDVTEPRRAEEAIRRTQKLESLGVMAGGIAHDFNNLLVAVLGNASLVRDELPPDSPVRERIADIERAAERASDLTRQLLTYAGRGRLEVAPVDVSRVAQEVAELTAVSIPARVQVEAALADSPPAVTGDASQLRQLVMNLLLNASDAIGDDAGRIELSVGLAELSSEELEEFSGDGKPEAGRWLALRVSDTGCGMAEDVRSRIFDPFFSTKFAGRGLGLAASHGIVRSHGGFVRVRSEPGHGSEFTVLLPPGSAPAPVAVSESEIGTAWQSDASILVVDDDASVSRVAARMLRSAGLEVEIADGGGEALAIWRRRGGADLVLLDLHMPGLSGEETWRALRELDPDVRVLFTSGYPEQDAESLLRSAPGAAFIQKPYKTADLLAKARRSLEDEA